MTEYLSKAVRGILVGVAAAVIGVSMTVAPAAAQSGQRVVVGERYVPTIWVDPDGCEHWVMDDGWEGYMTPHVTRQGIPVCRQQNLCGVMSTDTLFATDSAHIGTAGRQALFNFFRQTGAVSYTIVGHTDSRASDEYNISLSLRRANSVAQVAREAGARIADVRGYGERMPRAPNNTAAGMQQNRRVEILCWR